MATKLIVLFAALATAQAGNLIAPATYSAGPTLAYAAPAVHTAAIAAPAVAYSSAPAVSHSYFRQNSLRYATAAGPAVSYAGPSVSYAAPAHAVSYAAPAVSYAAPAHAVSYAAPAVTAIHAPAVGTSTQSVVRSLGGNSAVSHYSKAVDSAFSSVRKYDTRITNDGIALAHTPVVSSYAAPAYAAHTPIVSTYAAPAVSTYAAHSPLVSTYAAQSPVLSSYAAHAPVISNYAAHAPVVTAHTTFSGLGTQYAW